MGAGCCGVYMNKTIVVCVSMAALLVINGWGAQQEKNASQIIPFSSPPGDVIKAMSFNIRVDTFLDGFDSWGNRKQLVFDTLTDDAADVMGLQEALDHQVVQIQQALPQYGHYAVGRNDGKQKGESCAIFYRKEDRKSVV